MVNERNTSLIITFALTLWALRGLVFKRTHGRVTCRKKTLNKRNPTQEDLRTVSLVPHRARDNLTWSNELEQTHTEREHQHSQRSGTPPINEEPRSKNSSKYKIFFFCPRQLARLKKQTSLLNWFWCTVWSELSPLRSTKVPYPVGSDWIQCVPSLKQFSQITKKHTLWFPLVTSSHADRFDVIYFWDLCSQKRDRILFWCWQYLKKKEKHF